MLAILKQYIEGEMNVIEYTKDFITDELTGKVIVLENATISHLVKTPLQNETEYDVIELPENPIIALQKENEFLKQQILDTQNILIEQKYNALLGEI